MALEVPWRQARLTNDHPCLFVLLSLTQGKHSAALDLLDELKLLPSRADAQAVRFDWRATRGAERGCLNSSHCRVSHPQQEADFVELDEALRDNYQDILYTAMQCLYQLFDQTKRENSVGATSIIASLREQVRHNLITFAIVAPHCSIAVFTGQDDRGLQ